MSHQRPVERLEPLLASFAASDLTHLEMRDGEFAVELVRRMPKSQPTVAAAAAQGATAAPAQAPKAPAPVTNERIVRAELVGIVRMAKPILTEGMVFERDRDVAAIESLGVRTPVRSGGGGRVTRVLVTEGDAVEYGQALFVVERV